MNRIDCEKCLHSDFDDQDRLRCGLKKCQPEYSDMKETYYLKQNGIVTI